MKNYSSHVLAVTGQAYDSYLLLRGFLQQNHLEVLRQGPLNAEFEADSQSPTRILQAVKYFSMVAFTRSLGAFIDLRQKEEFVFDLALPCPPIHL